MNMDRPYFGRVTVNDSKIKLGKTELIEVLKRLVVQLSEHKSPSTSRIQIIVELSTDPLPESSIMSREQTLALEMQSLIVDDSEEVFPGVTAARVAEVMVTPEYEAYRLICEPDKRIGVPDHDIALIRSTYFSMFPDCIMYFPLWVE